MGVRYLETFMRKRLPDGIKPVDMAQEIQNFREANGVPNPLIVIDLKTFFRWALSNDNESFICGGRSQIFEKKLRTFFSKFKALGVRIVCFADGPPQNMEHWCLSHERKTSDEIKFLRGFEDCASTKALAKRAPTNYLSVFDRAVFQIVKEFGELHWAIRAENDSSVARYATQNRALAVLSKDSDFLIFFGRWHYWNVHDIDERTMCTTEFSREALRRELRIHDEQLPLFATLGGNEVIDYDEVKDFLVRIKRGRFTNFRDIVYYINGLPNRGKRVDQMLLTRICVDIKGQKDPRFIEKLQRSLEFFNTRTRYEEPRMQRALQQKILHMDECLIYCLHEELLTKYYTTYLDLSDPEMPAFVNLLDQFLAKITGILLKDKIRSGEYRTQRFICKPSAEEPYQTRELRPIGPEMDLPPLEELLFGPNNDRLEETRFELLAWIISPNYSGERLRSIDRDILTASATLLLLVEGNFISMEEADVALKCVEDLVGERIPETLEAPAEIKKRHLIVSFLIPVVQKLVNYALDCCGLGQYARVHHDGVYFHRKMQESEKGL